jgi:pimeloyl-ACP methyl ester carboxylesterase
MSDAEFRSHVGTIGGDGPRLAYEVVESRRDADVASASVLLCLHGNSSHRGIWRLVARRLRDWRCVLLDLRGHGDSEHVTPPAYNPEHHAADLARIVNTLGLGPYAMLAHSAGALAAARFISGTSPVVPAQMPAAFVWTDLDPLVPRWQVEYFHQRAGSVGRPLPSVDDAVNAFRRLYPAIREDRLRAFVSEGLRPVDRGWRMKLDPGTYAGWEPGDLRPALPRLRIPTLVLRGGKSIVSSAEGLAALRDGLPDCEIVGIDGGSHMLPLEHPEDVAAVIGDFLRRRCASTP